MSRTLRASILILPMIVLGTAAEAVDMTGTWTGRERCECFNDTVGRFSERYSDQVMEITQSGTDLNIQAYGELFNGNVIDHPKRSSKGEASLIACNTDPADNASFGEIARAKVRASARSGRLTVESLWNAHEAEICSCKSRFRRTDSVDPEIGDCSESNEVDEWHLEMLDVEPPGPGCHTVEHPSTEWLEVDCGDAQSDSPDLSRLRGYGSASPGVGRTAGNGTDWLLKVFPTPHSTFVKVTGSFENVSGVTSITDTLEVNGHEHGKGADWFSLQLNSNTFHHSPACQGQPDCQGWQQVVYSSRGTGNLGNLIIQYWLIGYNRPCPSGSAWEPSLDKNGVFTGDCYKNAVKHHSIHTATAADLGAMHLTGIATHSKDAAVVRIGSRLHAATVYKAVDTAPDSNVGLFTRWSEAEFNVVGFASASHAKFSPNSSVDVRMTANQIWNPGGGAVTLRCEGGGTTGETNDLTLRGECTPVSRSHPPAHRFSQDNLPHYWRETTRPCLMGGACGAQGHNHGWWKGLTMKSTGCDTHGAAGDFRSYFWKLGVGRALSIPECVAQWSGEDDDALHTCQQTQVAVSQCVPLTGGH